MTWDDWVRAHATTFGLTRPEHLETLVRWARIFGGGGFTPAEMAAASEHVALHDPPRFLDGHLRSLLDRALAERARRAALSKPDAGWADCPDCGGSGLVPVPSWKPFERRWGEACCSCTCPAGARRNESWEGYRSAAAARGERVGPLTPVDVYDAERPGWRERLAAQRRQHAEELAALGAAGGLAAAVGKVVGRAKRAAG